MSFDVFFQRFRNGHAETGGGDDARRILDSHVVAARPSSSFLSVQVGDGSADIYLRADDMMANHVSGTDPWDLLVRAAVAARWVILPAGCPTCATAEDQVQHVPAELRDGVRLVRTGADLLDVVRSS